MVRSPLSTSLLMKQETYSGAPVTSVTSTLGSIFFRYFAAVVPPTPPPTTTTLRLAPRTSPGKPRTPPTSIEPPARRMKSRRSMPLMV